MESVGELFSWVQQFLTMLGVWDMLGYIMTFIIVLSGVGFLIRFLQRV